MFSCVLFFCNSSHMYLIRAKTQTHTHIHTAGMRKRSIVLEVFNVKLEYNPFMCSVDGFGLFTLSFRLHTMFSRLAHTCSLPQSYTHI